MTPKQKKIALFIGISVIAGGYLYWKSKENEKEGNALLDIINKGYSQTDKNSAAEQAIKDVQDTKYQSGQKFKIGKVITSDIKQALPAIQVNNKLISGAIKGGGTDAKTLFAALAQIKNKMTLKASDELYKGAYGKGIFETMKGETALNNPQYAIYSDKTKNNLIVPFLSDAHWHPAISAWLQKLPVY